MSRANRQCVDCLAEGVLTKRKTPHPGPRCVSHHRAIRKARSSSSWEKRILATYGITAEDYFRILAFQDGKCAICRRATGASRRLSVDHDHSLGYIRGLCCSPCNVHVLGHLRDSVDALQRAIDYLNNPPAIQVIGQRVAPIEERKRSSAT